MSSKIKFIIGIYFLFFASPVFSVPPYFWYSTHAIGHYQHCVFRTCMGMAVATNTGALDDALAFNQAITALQGYLTNPSNQYNRTDEQVNRSRWVGSGAEINYNDFVLFGGHGNGFGPVLLNPGCDTVTPSADLRFGGGIFLKWMQALACEWFCAPAYACGVDEFVRWSNTFQGIHCVMGHRANTYDAINSYYMSNDFLNRWLVLGQEICLSWIYSQFEWVYNSTNGTHGVQPAVMAHNNSYMWEKYSDATDDQADPASKFMCLGWGTIGTPAY
jgi:hypothetical protein